jgi:hypothetical protein
MVLFQSSATFVGVLVFNGMFFGWSLLHVPDADVLYRFR